MSRAAAFCSSLIPALFLAACTDAPAVDDRALEGKAFPGEDCPEWGCTGNSPTMGPYAFHELDLDGRANDQGVSIEGIQLANNGAPVRVSFAKGKEMYAEDDWGTTYTGTQLDGLVFHLRTPTGRFLLTINHVTPTASSNTKVWVGAPDRVQTQEVVWADDATPTRTHPVCANPPGHEVAPGGGPAWANLYEAIFFTGDRYDGKSKTVIASTYEDAGNWFNIGCAGSALAKEFLTRHTTATSDDDHHSGTSERQALLKMYTGDFCGVGHTFTQPGTPLTWENPEGWSAFDGTEIGFESFWDEGGAMCLTQHRIDSTWQAAVAAMCGIPACPGTPFPSAWEGHAYLKTAIPQP